MGTIRRLTGAALATAGAWALARRALASRRSIDVAGKVVVITGGSRGLGLELARVFASEGARLALLARDAEELDRARSELAQFGVEVWTRACDLTDPAQTAAAAKELERSFGWIDVLVHDAGVISAGPIGNMAEEDFESAMDIHFRAPLRLTLALLPIVRRPGRIVTIASIGGLVSVPHLVPYCASKFALVGLSDGLRAELAREGIRVTTVCPGLMRTGSHWNARFKGRHPAEFTTFSLLACSPITSIDSARAARRIVEACRRGESFLVLSPQARLLHLASTLAPVATAEAMALVARLLPEADWPEGDREREGHECTTSLAPSMLTRMGDRAAVRNNEMPHVPVRRGNGAG